MEKQYRELHEVPSLHEVVLEHFKKQAERGLVSEWPRCKKPARDVREWLREMDI